MTKGARYCLANYNLSIVVPTSINIGVNSISIGGEGSYLDSINISRNTNLFETTADSTGSWIHTKNLDKSGTVSITINQVSDKIVLFKALMKAYYNSDDKVEGLSLTVLDGSANPIVVCNDCLLTNIPEQSFSSSPTTQTWTFTCGQIEFI